MYAMQDKSRTQESDRFFKSIPADWYESDDGNVEAPTGWFGLVDIDDDFRQSWPSADTGESIPASVEDGYYLVTIDNNGLVWAEQAPIRSGTLANFREKQREYSVWYNQDDDDV